MQNTPKNPYIMNKRKEQWKDPKTALKKTLRACLKIPNEWTESNPKNFGISESHKKFAKKNWNQTRKDTNTTKNNPRKFREFWENLEWFWKYPKFRTKIKKYKKSWKVLKNSEKSRKNLMNQTGLHYSVRFFMWVTPTFLVDFGAALYHTWHWWVYTLF